MKTEGRGEKMKCPVCGGWFWTVHFHERRMKWRCLGCGWTVGGPASVLSFFNSQLSELARLAEVE